jgi:hypothetical protein
VRRWRLFSAKAAGISVISRIFAITARYSEAFSPAMAALMPSAGGEVSRDHNFSSS